MQGTIWTWMFVSNDGVAYSPPPPVAQSDVRLLYTVNVGPGNTAPQPSPADSYGGFASHTPVPDLTVGNLVPDPPAAPPPGYADYRCLFLVNANPGSSWYNVRVYVQAQPAGGSDFLVGLDPAGVVPLGSALPQAVRPASGTTPPAGVTFSAPSAYETGLAVGTLPPNYGRAVWVMRTSDPLPPGTAVAKATIAVAGLPSP